jgi:hypothetical protein
MESFQIGAKTLLTKKRACGTAANIADSSSHHPENET